MRKRKIAHDREREHERRDVASLSIYLWAKAPSCGSLRNISLYEGMYKEVVAYVYGGGGRRDVAAVGAAKRISRYGSRTTLASLIASITACLSASLLHGAWQHRALSRKQPPTRQRSASPYTFSRASWHLSLYRAACGGMTLGERHSAYRRRRQ